MYLFDSLSACFLQLEILVTAINYKFVSLSFFTIVETNYPNFGQNHCQECEIPAVFKTKVVNVDLSKGFKLAHIKDNA